MSALATFSPSTSMYSGSTALLTVSSVTANPLSSSALAVSLFPRTAGAASAVYGFVHSVIAALVGFVAGILYDGTVIPTANIMLICAAVGVLSLPLTRQNPASVAST